MKKTNLKNCICQKYLAIIEITTVTTIRSWYWTAKFQFNIGGWNLDTWRNELDWPVYKTRACRSKVSAGQVTTKMENTIKENMLKKTLVEKS